MEKRYQVFISSTFVDLQDERRGVLQAVLELDHMPAGMELFPASDESSWGLIRDVIDHSDYYVLIVGGRYGSEDKSGLGYTEREYDYAISKQKCIIPFLHSAPHEIPRGKTEQESGSWEKLEQFRKKVESVHTCAYWKNGEDLRARVVTSLVSAMKRHPGIGWIRADRVPSDASLGELVRLQARVAELEAAQSVAPQGTQDLAQGSDSVDITVCYTVQSKINGTKSKKWGHVYPTWDAIFGELAPYLIVHATDSKMREVFGNFIEQRTHIDFFAAEEKASNRILDVDFVADDYMTCLVQLRALGLIEEWGTSWRLTPYGNGQMVRVRAIRKGST